MPLSPPEQEQIVSLMTRMYHDICAIEAEHQLWVGGGDFRPRIEHFHDAIRALTSQEPRHFEDGGRLAIEQLNYDLSCLRYILAKPLSPFTNAGHPGSANVELLALDHKLVEQAKRPDRKTKERLVELYRHYGVLFAALLKPQADDDCHERGDALNQTIENIQVIIANLAKGNLNIGALVQNLDDADMRYALVAFLQNEQARAKDQQQKMVAALKAQVRKREKQLAAIEKMHGEYALSQLALFENAKDMLKAMAGQGMNLVGSFVEASMAQTKREMGR